MAFQPNNLLYIIMFYPHTCVTLTLATLQVHTHNNIKRFRNYISKLLRFQEAIPLRIKGLYIINQPFIFNMVFQIFKPFLQEKLRSRIVFMGNDRELLHKHISPKYLPEQYGGTVTIPNVTGAQWLELLLMCDKEFCGKKIDLYCLYPFVYGWFTQSKVFFLIE